MDGGGIGHHRQLGLCVRTTRAGLGRGKRRCKGDGHGGGDGRAEETTGGRLHSARGADVIATYALRGQRFVRH